ncbi:MAG: hypothetical protein ACOCWY_00565 [Thermodesulfobacteriota bacterium]
MKPILKWQYDQLIKELLLLQEHSADPSCPCETESEMCVRKHLFIIEAYAQETMTIEENETYSEKLGTLAKEAKELRSIEEKRLEGEAEEFPVKLTDWTRDWRKTFEAYTLEA